MSETRDTAGNRILLVEDESAHAELISGGFSRAGSDFTLEVASTLSEARESLERNPPALVIADWLLPDGNGIELIFPDQSRAEYPVVVMTSQGNEQVAVEALKAGALDYVVKSPEIFSDMPNIARRAIREFGHIKEKTRAERKLRESEGRFRQMAETISNVFWLQTGEQVNYVNRAFEFLFGLPREDLYSDIRSCLEVVHEDDRQRAAEAIEGVIRGEKRIDQEEFRLVRPDGTMRWVQATTYQVVQTELGPRSAGTVEDITERRMHVEELARARDEAEAASRAKSQFLANMSHELRTPINGIVGMTDLLLRTELSEDQRKFLGMSKEASRKLLAIVEDLLELSSIETSGTALDYSEFDLRDMVGSVCESRATAFRLRGLEYSYSVDEDVPAVVSGDSARIGQVLSNLLSNAAKFTEKGSVDVRVKLADRVRIPGDPSRSDGAVTLMFMVKDTGIGVPEGKQDEIFDSFTLGEDCMTKEFGGTGMGLAIARHLVQLHGGRIWVESAPGQGSLFLFTAVFRVSAVGRNATSRMASGFGMNGKLTVLYAEDDPANRFVGVRFLEKLGHEVVEAEDGVAAIEALKNNAVDLVLMDIQMPKLNGLEVLQKIRDGEIPGVPGNLPVVAVTAYAMESERDTFVRQGMDGYLAKPFEADQLLEAIQNAVGK